MIYEYSWQTLVAEKSVEGMVLFPSLCSGNVLPNEIERGLQVSVDEMLQ